MSPSKSRKKKSKKTPDFKPFVYADDEGPVWCPLCVKETGDKTPPLSHFPIFVPNRPMGKRIPHPDPSKDSGQIVHWTTDYDRMCRRHAIFVLESMKDKDLIPSKKYIKE